MAEESLDSSFVGVLALCGFGGIFNARFKASSRFLSSDFLVMTDIKSLDPETRSHALVGQFLQTWGLMESNLNNTIGEALGLDRLQAIVVFQNITFHSKIHIVSTLIDLAAISKEDTISYQKTLSQIADFAPTRNMVAHTLFLPDDSGEGVKFFVRKAKGKLLFPPTIWSPDDFREKCALCAKYIVELREIKKALVRINLREILRKRVETSKSGLFGLGFPNHPSLHSQSPLGSNPLLSTLQTAAQTPQDEEE